MRNQQFHNPMLRNRQICRVNNKVYLIFNISETGSDLPDDHVIHNDISDLILTKVIDLISKQLTM